MTSPGGILTGSTSKKIQDGGRESPTPRTWAKPWKKEKNYKVDSDKKYKLKLVSDENGWYLDTDIYDFVAEVKSNLVTTKTLGIAFEPEEQFENPNGEPLILDRDFYGNMREKSTIPGPFAFDKSEKTKIKIYLDKNT